MQNDALQTKDDFWSLMNGKMAVARLFKDDPKNAAQAWEATGMALEFAFKAAIWHDRRLNRWPDGGELHTHDLQELFRLLGTDHKTLPVKLRAALKVAFSWRVEQRYKAERVPRKKARQFYEAAFDSDGVVQWLKSL